MNIEITIILDGREMTKEKIRQTEDENWNILNKGMKDNIVFYK